jgi:hypothetical protein
MATQDAHFVQTYYSGIPAERLIEARALFAALADRLTASLTFQGELDQLRWHSQVLNEQMRTMDLGQLCCRCAARPGGGCCSAYMADNTDSIQMLINLLLGVNVTQQQDSGGNCCFLGALGCLFLIKPIFCLNYNCSHILDSGEPVHLKTLYQRAAAVLSQQTKIEGILIEILRNRDNAEEKPVGIEILRSVLMP